MKIVTLEEGHLERVSCSSCSGSEKALCLCYFNFVMANYSADGMASECIGVAELT